MARKSQDAIFELQNLLVLTHVERSLENYQPCVGRVGEIRRLAEDFGSIHPGWSRWHSDAIDAYIAMDEHHHAAAVIEDLRDKAGNLALPSLLAVTARGEGQMAAELGEHEIARQHFERSLALLDAYELPLERGRTLIAFGTFERRSRRKARARALLGEAADVFARTGARLWGELARRELERAGASGSRSVGLTVTEAAIAELAANGTRNREIAARLFVTVKTVESTLTSIYRKLNIRSRTELAAWHALANRGS